MRNSYIFLTAFLSLMAFHEMASAEDGVTDTEITIGESTTLTLARPKSVHSGAQLFFAKLNASGGVNGRKIKLLMMEDGYVPKKAYDNIKQMIEKDKVFMFFQNYGTTPVAAALPLIEAANIPLLAPGSGSLILREPIRKNVYHVRNSYLPESRYVVDFIMKKNGAADVCLFLQDDALGVDGSISTAKALSEIGKQVKISGTYKRLSEDIDEAFLFLKKADCKAIIMWGQTGPALKFLTRAKQEKFTPLFIAATPLSGAEFYSKAGKLSDNLFAATTAPLPTDRSDEFVVKYLSDAGDNPLKSDPSFFEGYLDAAVLTQAIRLTGKNLTRDSLRETLDEKMQNAKFGKIKISFSKTDHQGLKQVFLNKVTPTGLEVVK